MTELPDADADAAETSSGRYGPLVAKIIDDVGREIVEGRLEPGTVLSSVDLARRFSTSRTPVRDALTALEQEGLVEIRLRRQARVAEPTLEQVRDVYEVRRQLYALVSQLIVRTATDAEIAGMWKFYAELKAAADAGDVAGYFSRNVEFRRYEADVCGNPYLQKTLNALGLHTLQSRRTSLSQPGRLTRSLTDHERLILAYTDRDEEVAVAITQALVTEGYRAVVESSGSQRPQATPRARG